MKRKEREKRLTRFDKTRTSASRDPSARKNFQMRYLADAVIFTETVQMYESLREVCQKV